MNSEEHNNYQQAYERLYKFWLSENNLSESVSNYELFENWKSTEWGLAQLEEELLTLNIICLRDKNIK